ncbi:MAG: hypothetical protein AAF604_04785 [Acidobacteriota bacterium]
MRRRAPHADLPGIPDLVEELGRLSEELDEALRFQRSRAERWAESENAYRLARAAAQLEAVDELQKAKGWDRPTVDQQRAWVDLQTEKERVEAHLADKMLDAAREAVRARRAQLSAMQSVATAVRTEIEFARGQAA